MTKSEREIKCFGCTVEELETHLWGDFMVQMDPLMTAMGMASDAQEELARGMTERARQTLNRQKWLLAKIKDRNRATEAA